MESRWSVAASFRLLHCLTGFAATASYRLHPLIILNPKNPVPQHLAKKFAGCFSPGVVKVSKDGKVGIYRFIPHAAYLTAHISGHNRRARHAKRQRIAGSPST